MHSLDICSSNCMIANMIIRPATIDDAFAITRVHVETWKTTYKGIIPDYYLESIDYARRDAYWRETLLKASENEFTLVAENNDGEVVAFATAGCNRDNDSRFDSELRGIYVLQSFQGIGIGKTLVLSATRLLLNKGHRSMIVWVLAANPARHFYENLAAVQVSTRKIEIGLALLDEVGYGWDDLKKLLEAA